MLWGWGKSSLREKRQKTTGLGLEKQEAETRKAEQAWGHQGLSSAETSFPLEPWRQPGGWGQCPPGGPQPGSPAPQRSRQPLSTAGQSWGGQGSVVWARSSLFPNQGSWKRLRVCNLGWGLTGGLCRRR